MFAYQVTLYDANSLMDKTNSLYWFKNVIELELPVGNLVVLNNLFWLHGRAPFEKNPNLNRELLRQRGHFYE